MTTAVLGAGGAVLSAGQVDVGVQRERNRRRRLATVAVVLGLPAGYLWYRLLDGRPFSVFALPDLDPFLLVALLLILMLPAAIVLPYLTAGRSPHTTYQPDQIDVRLADVVGVEPVKDEVVRSLNLFLAHRTYREQMGGRPRRGLLFEGPPGTGKTHLAKAMAAEAGVPFLFVSATAFQSMFYGATARKIRSYFKVLRRTALREGGAIGFLEEIDAIATTRRGMAASAAPEGVAGCLEVSGAGVVRTPMVSESAGGVVNELLVQMQSFDAPMGLDRVRGALVDGVNRLLPAHRQLRKPTPPRPNLLLIAATNRADALDPALLRPGRFDKRLSFGLPDKPARRALVDHFLASRAHAPELDEEERRDALAAITTGATPVVVENLLDEALVNAVRRGDRAMSWADVESARVTASVGLGQPVTYTEHEQRLIATHEAGHAVTAWLLAPHRRLEVLSIIKRGSALGLLAHGDRDDVYTRSRAELLGLIAIAMGGQVAEELFFGDVSTGPAGDLQYATTVACQMVGAAGMDGSLISYAAVQTGALADSNLVGKVLADAEGRGRVERLLAGQRAEVARLLAAHRHLIEALRDALLDRHELVGSEITDVLAGAVRPGGA
jgi:cell division protease FtsH